MLPPRASDAIIIRFGRASESENRQVLRLYCSLDHRSLMVQKGYFVIRPLLLKLSTLISAPHHDAQISNQ